MNAVPIDQVGITIAEVLRQINNGRYKAQRAGIDTQMPPDKAKVDFTINIALPGGINAIPRAESTQVEGAEVTVIEESASKQTEVKGIEKSSAQSSDSGHSETESGQTQQTSNESQQQNYGRGQETETKFTE